MSRRRQLLRGGRKGAQLVANVADIAYKAADGKIMVVAPDLWSTSLGIPVGVVVIPSGFAPDNGKARIISLKWGSESGTSSTSVSSMAWSSGDTNTILTNYNRVPITNNVGSAITGSNNYGYLPSDRFTGTISYVDPTAKYYDTTTSYRIPSPYLGDAPNPAYYAPISGYNNALSDFDGKGNTDVLVGFGSRYAAGAARNYKAAGAEEIEWYLPAVGELAYIIPRFNKIQAALTKVNAPQLVGTYYYFSSSEHSSDSACCVYMNNGLVNNLNKQFSSYVRPFAQLDF